VKEKLEFVRLPILLFVIFFVGKLVYGAVAGVDQESYDSSNRFFSMVILQVHIALIWAAVGRRYRGYRLGGAVTAVVLAVAVSQLLILLGTAFSYIAGVDTFFNFPEALNAPGPVPFGTAMVGRVFGLIANCVTSGILAMLGYAMGGLIPVRSALTMNN
jgi:hypothetical protein